MELDHAADENLSKQHFLNNLTLPNACPTNLTYKCGPTDRPVGQE